MNEKRTGEKEVNKGGQEIDKKGESGGQEWTDCMRWKEAMVK